MASANDGGDHGGSAEEPTHPKSSGGGMLLLEDKPPAGVEYVVEEISSSNWHPPVFEGLGADEEELLGGEVDMEDDVFVEEDPDEEPAPPPVPWRLMSRYLGRIAPSAETLKVHFKKVWNSRTGVLFAPIKRKWFIITLFSEGDYNFVLNGGPWIHLGNALLVKALEGSARPSATDLSSVPMWVHMYDVPWDKQTVANGRKWGSKLGKIVTVEADARGSKFKDYLRVRIELPIDKRLQTKLTTGVKDRPETHSSYVLRYERVPYFCFWCGFIGHNDTVCEKKRRGVPSLAYDSSLRVSPMRKYEHREAYEPPAVRLAIKRGVDFSSSADNLDNLGRPAVRSKGRPVYKRGEPVVPEPVNASDGFEQNEQPGDDKTDRDLFVMLHELHMQYPKESLASLRERMYAERERLHKPNPVEDMPPLIEDTFQSVGPTPVLVKPLAMMFGTRSFDSAEKIPTLKGLSSLVFSENSTDTAMLDVTSMLGKRLARHAEDAEEQGDSAKAIVVHEEALTGNAQKRGRVKAAVITSVQGKGVEGEGNIDEIIQIKVNPRRTEDVLAWAPSPNGIFIVKSAYWLGMEELSQPIQGATSRAPNGRRAIWKALWGCPAPLRCPMARALWQAMTKEWALPDLEKLENKDTEWVLHLLEDKMETMKTMILMTLWRIWHCRNEAKRKHVISWEKVERASTKKKVPASTLNPWKRPPVNWKKLIVDGSYYSASGTGGTGAVLRDPNGEIIVSACRFLPSCQNPLEAELEACRHGLALALEWSTLQCVLEMDCSEAVEMISSGELDRSSFTAIT
ncbi:hypothetical protein ACQ4PT_019967 [Festuca glaucescens]